jgi:hypothetical protein
MFGVFCSCLQFPICIRKQLLGFFRVTSQVIFVLTFRFPNFLVGLNNMMLSLREISIMGINVLTGRLCNRYASRHEHSSQRTAQHYIFRLHDDYSFLEKSEPGEF